MVEFSNSQAILSNPTTQPTTTITTAETVVAAATKQPTPTTTTIIDALHKTSTCVLSQQQKINQDLQSASAVSGVNPEAKSTIATGPAQINGVSALRLNEPLPSTSAPCATSASGGYKLRALANNTKSTGTEEENLWSNNFNVPSLSCDLIDETLNYFVNCRHRSSQITKTFDDSDAYILLLQEKEMDLELVARIGQDLLKQFNEVKDSNEGLKEELAKFHELNERLKDELAKCKEDKRQLQYELSSKASLLDTFMEEEEHLHHQDTTATLNRSDAQDEEYTSLRSQSDRVTSSNENNLYKRLCELQDELLTKDEVLFKQNLAHQERNLHLELQLRESERRLSGLEAENEILRESQKELYDELRTYSRNFAELLKIFSESQRESRMHDIGNMSFDSFLEPPPSFDSNLNSTALIDTIHYDTQHHYHHQNQQQQAACQQHQHQCISKPLVRDSSNRMVMSSSLHEEMQASLLKPGELREIDDDNLDCDQHHDDEANESEIKRVSPGCSPRHHRNHYHRARTHQTMSHSHNHHRQNHLQTDSDSGGVSDGTDSGLHTTNISTSTTPINNGLNSLDTDSEGSTCCGCGSRSGSDGATSGPEDVRAKHRKHWLGLSTFTLTTLLLLCLSATLNTSTNYNLAQKLQLIKFER